MSPRLELLTREPVVDGRTNRPPLLSLGMSGRIDCWRPPLGLELDAYRIGEDSELVFSKILNICGVQYQPPRSPLALGVRSPSCVGCELVIWRNGELTSRSRFDLAISAGDERYIMGEEEGATRLGVLLIPPCDDAASF